MTFRPRIFTFYSYKGGVGRSMAVLNMAYYLHARGRHVLMVDLDLDAPGASGFLHRNGELTNQAHPGDVVDVLAAVVRSVTEAASGTPPSIPPLRLEAFLRSVRSDRYAPAVHPRATRARLDVLAADDSRDYPLRLSSLDLPSLSADQIAQASELLRALLIGHLFPFHQPWQEAGETPEATGYDYILVDSRTGLSEIGGLCVGPLSDRLVVLCGLNDQNIAGTEKFLELVGLERKARTESSEPWDDADTSGDGVPRPASLGPKPTLLVASPVPGGEMTYKKERMDELEARIGLRPVKLSYHPQMALMETLFVRDHDEEYLALEYGTLAKRVMAMVGDSSEQLERPLNSMFVRRPSESESPGRFATLPQRLSRMALMEGASGIYGPFSLSQFGVPPQIQDQVRRLRITLAATPDLAAEAALNWADELNTEEARKANNPEMFQTMEKRYSEALAIKPDFHEALHNWGFALSNWAKTKQGVEVDALFNQATAKYQQELAIKPDKHEALNNWGIALFDWAQTKQGAEADALFNQATSKFERALAVKPDLHEALSNWGLALSERAQIKQGAEADALFSQAAGKYEQALAIKPDKHEALNSWGNVFSNWAKTKQGAEADELFEQAVGKYEHALAMKPDKHESLNSWGTALSNWAKTKQGAEADALFVQAAGKFERALTIKPNYASSRFNVACLNALRDDPSGTMKALNDWRAVASEARKADLDNDSDFDRVRDHPDFVAFRNSLPD